jgi:hypothetical protein
VDTPDAGAPDRESQGMTTIVKAAGAAQFLSLVPRLLGFTPRTSVAIVPMSGGRSLGGMRLDLPADPDDPSDLLAATVIGMVCRVTGSDGFLAVVYTDEPSAPALPRATLAAALVRAGDASGLSVVDVFVVAADGWGSLLDESPHPRPLTDLTATDPVAADPTAPEPVRGDQASGARLPEVSAADRRLVGHAHRSLSDALSVVCGIPSERARQERIDPSALAAACELDDLPRLFENALGWDPQALDPMHTALLGWCLQRPALRDVALVQWASDVRGGEQAMEAQHRWEDGEEYPADLASVMWGEDATPDPERLQSALTLTLQVAACTARRRRAGALAVCAWLSWALGRSTHADLFAQMALEIDHTHGLADIVRSFVAATHLPDWAFRRG